MATGLLIGSSFLGADVRPWYDVWNLARPPLTQRTRPPPTRPPWSKENTDG